MLQAVFVESVSDSLSLLAPIFTRRALSIRAEKERATQERCKKFGILIYLVHQLVMLHVDVAGDFWVMDADAGVAHVREGNHWILLAGERKGSVLDPVQQPTHVMGMNLLWIRSDMAPVADECAGHAEEPFVAAWDSDDALLGVPRHSGLCFVVVVG